MSSRSRYLRPNELTGLTGTPGRICAITCGASTGDAPKDRPCLLGRSETVHRVTLAGGKGYVERTALALAVAHKRALQDQTRSMPSHARLTRSTAARRLSTAPPPSRSESESESESVSQSESDSQSELDEDMPYDDEDVDSIIGDPDDRSVGSEDEVSSHYSDDGDLPVGTAFGWQGQSLRNAAITSDCRLRKRTRRPSDPSDDSFARQWSSEVRRLLSSFGSRAHLGSRTPAPSSTGKRATASLAPRTRRNDPRAPHHPSLTMASRTRRGFVSHLAASSPPSGLSLARPNLRFDQGSVRGSAAMAGSLKGIDILLQARKHIQERRC